MRDSVVVRHDTIFTSHFLHDSVDVDRYHTMIATDSGVFVRDSVVHKRFRIKYDSIYVYKTDTAFVNRYVVKAKEVPRKRNWFDWLCYSVTGALLLFLLTYLLTIFKKIW